MDHSIVRTKLDQLIQESAQEDYNSISALIGKNHAYIQQFIKRGIPKALKERDIAIIAKHFKVQANFLTGNQGFSESSNQFLAENNILSIPYYDIGASAGAGSFIDGETPIGTLPFSAEHLSGLGLTNADALAVLKVRGDSMHPTLNDGDDILIDTSEPTIAKDGIYVLRLDEGLMVKRISVNPVNKLFTIKSDNALYETWENCPPDTIQLIGRVAWTGRRI